MREVVGRPTIRQLQKWCKNKTIFTFKFSHRPTILSVIISHVSPALFPFRSDTFLSTEDVNEKSGWYEYNKSTQYYELKKPAFCFFLESIASYFIPEKENSLLLNRGTISNQDVILELNNTRKYVNKKLLAERSKFFRKLIKNEENKLSPWTFFKCKAKVTKTILINLDPFFDNEHELNLLLYLLDQEEFDNFIFTMKDALSLLEIIHKFPLGKMQASKRQIEYEVKNKFFELMGDITSFSQPEKLGIKAQSFLNDLKSELVAYCKLNKTNFYQNLLIYCSQIEKTGKLIIDASKNPAYLESLRLIIFCNFKISTLITRGVIPQLFKHLADFSSLPLRIFKMYPYPCDEETPTYSQKNDSLAYYAHFYNYESNLEPIFELMSNSKTLCSIQIGYSKTNSDNSSNSKASYIEKPPIYCCPLQLKTVQQFNSLKPMIDSRLRTFYQTAVVHCFFNKYLPTQQSRILTEFLTLDDLEKVRQASREVYLESKKLSPELFG